MQIGAKHIEERQLEDQHIEPRLLQRGENAEEGEEPPARTEPAKSRAHQKCRSQRDGNDADEEHDLVELIDEEAAVGLQDLDMREIPRTEIVGERIERPRKGERQERSDEGRRLCETGFAEARQGDAQLGMSAHGIAERRGVVAERGPHVRELRGDHCQRERGGPKSLPVEAQSFEEGPRLERGIDEQPQSGGKDGEVRQMVERLKGYQERGGVQVPMGARLPPRAVKPDKAAYDPGQPKQDENALVGVHGLHAQSGEQARGEEIDRAEMLPVQDAAHHVQTDGEEQVERENANLLGRKPR